SVLVGGRQTWSDIEYANIRELVGDIDPDFAEFEITADFSVSEFTPRVGLVYGLADNVNAYVSYSKGFIPQTGATRAGGVIEPESGVQWEVGAKSELFGGALGINAAAYLIEREEVQASDPANVPGEDFVVAGRDQRHSGVAHVPYHLASAFLQYQKLDGPLAGLNASIGYSYYGEYYHREDNEYRFKV